MGYPSRFINVVRFPIENCVYRTMVRRRQRLVGRKYSDEPYGCLQHWERLYWEFWLDRCEMTTMRLGGLYHAYLALRGFGR